MKTVLNEYRIPPVPSATNMTNMPTSMLYAEILKAVKMKKEMFFLYFCSKTKNVVVLTSAHILCFRAKLEK